MAWLGYTTLQPEEGLSAAKMSEFGVGMEMDDGTIAALPEKGDDAAATTTLAATAQPTDEEE